MKSLILSFFLIAAGFMLAACDPAGYQPKSPSATGEKAQAVAPQAAPVPLGKVKAEVGEKAPFEIKGDTVYVNNRICAYSGTWMREDTLGNFISKVEYDGPDPRFKGKTLIFNQCCGGCIGAFPAKWKAERDKIMHFHGLT